MKITANPFLRSFLLHFSKSQCLSLVLAVAGACAVENASAATYTYSNITSNTAETPTLWSAGTNWSAVPLSASDTTLSFSGTLAAGATIFTQNDLVGTFMLNRLSFIEAGPATGTIPTINLTGGALQFVTNGATAPTIAFNTTGTVKPTVTINNDIIATDALTIGGATDGTISGTISGAGAITKSGNGNVTFSHANTYTGLTTVSTGTLVVSDALALGGTAQGVTVTVGASFALAGNITVSNEAITIAGIGLASTSGGALRNSSGNNTWAGDVILGLGSTALTSNAARIGSAGGTLTVSGTIKDGEAANLSLRNGDSAGAVVLTGQNTYTGTTHIVVGPVTVSSINSVTTNLETGAIHSTSSNLGAPVTIANGTLYFSSGTANQGQLFYNGTGETTDRNIVLAGGTSGALIDQSGATGLLKILGTISSPGVAATNQQKTLTITGTGLGEIAGAISDAVLGTAGQLATSLTKSGTGNWTLSGANTFTGKTSITGGSLTVSSLNSVVGGTASSSLGAPVSLANGTINLSGGQIIYTGTGEITDRVINLAGTTSGIAITQSGTGLLKFTSALTASGTGSKVFTLQGSTAGAGEIAGAIIDNTATNKTSLAKAGTGTWTLSGANTYTGTTAISGGTLVLKSGGSLVTSSMTVGNATSGNGTLNIAGNYTIGSATTGAITVRGGNSSTGQGTLSLIDDSINTLTLTSAAGSGLVLGSTIAGNGTAMVNLELGSGLTSDLIQIGQNLQVNASGATINLSKVTGSTLSAGTYTLMTYAAGSTFTGGFTIGSTPTLVGQVANYSLSNTGTAQQLVVAIASQGVTAYWTGAQTAIWNTINGSSTNFRLNADGTGAEVLPDSTTDVYFAANSAANTTSTLGQDFTIKSLNFNGAASTSYTIGGSSTLTLTNGLNVDAASANHTISTKVALGANQTWNLGGTSAQLLTVSGVISGANLTLTGGRKLVLAGTNTFASVTIDAGSTLQIGASGTAGSITGSVTTNGTLIINRSDATTFANTISGTGGFTKTGGGTLTLSGNNTYSGVTNIGGGILSVSTANAFGTASNTAGAGVVADASGILQLSGNVTITGEALSLTAKAAGGTDYGISNLSGNNEWTGNITLLANGVNNSRINSTAGILTLSGDINAAGIAGTNIVTKGTGGIVFSGDISGNVGIITTAAGIYTFSGDNTFNGYTAFQGGGTIVASHLNSFATNAGLGTVRSASSSLGVATSTTNNVLNFGNGSNASASTGTLKYVGTGETTDRTVVLSGIAGTATLDHSGTGTLKFVGNVTNITNAGSKILNLTGSTAGNGEIAGNIVAGVGTTAVTKNGSNTWTLSGTNTYTGTTTVNSGVLLINGNSSGAVGAVNVAGGAFLGGNGTVGGATSISGSHSAGASTINEGIGIQTFSSSLSYSATSSFSWDLGSETTTGAGTNFDSVVVNGSMSVDGAIFKVVVNDLNLDSTFWASSKTWDVFETGEITGNFGAFELYDSSNLASAFNYSARGSFSFSSAGQLSWSVPEPTNALAGVLIAAGLLRRRRGTTAM